MHARLQCRRLEIERAILFRLYAVSDSIESLDPDYVEGLRAAVPAALDFGLAIIERGEEHAPPIPTVLLAQARMAARIGIGLAAVQSRYIAGNAVLSDYLIQEAEKNLPGRTVLTRLMRTQAVLFERLLAVVGEEYVREEKSRVHTPEQRRAARVQRLLDGELIDTTSLAYDISAHHVGVIAAGSEASGAIRKLATTLDRRLMLIPRSEETVWAWFGGRRRADPSEIARIAALVDWPARVSLAIGEPGQGLAGWRLTHKQARAALPLARRRPGDLVRYIDAAVLASCIQDDLLTCSLHEIFLAPLERNGRQGFKLLETLRAYFSTEQTISAAAALLKISRPTVRSHLDAIEERIGLRIDAAKTEIEVALRLQDIGAIPNARDERPNDNSF